MKPIKEWLKILREQLIEVDAERRLSTMLVISVTACEVLLAVLANFVVGFFIGGAPINYGVLVVVMLVWSVMEFPYDRAWSMSDQEIQYHCEGRLHRVAMGSMAILGLLLALAAVLVNRLRNT